MSKKNWLKTAILTLITFSMFAAQAAVASSWQTFTIDSANNVGRYTSIAIDSSGRAHISYCNYTNDDLKYATNASGSWQTFTLDSTGVVGRYTSIAIDSSGQAHISYYNYTNGDLKYATNASGSWQTFTLDSTGDVGQYTSIALDQSGQAHISYYDYTNGDLKYATLLLPNIAISPQGHDFGSIPVGSSSSPLVITISNTGTADLHISNIALSDTTNFHLDINGGSSPCGTLSPTIPPGGSGTLAITFAPSSAGALASTLSISSDDPDTPTLTISLTGRGAPPLNVPVGKPLTCLLFLAPGLLGIAGLKKRVKATKRG
ncbi:MAG: choice-of-anchor D domain-containing protein [bacterium]|nr:choice-of-anchor D domain-containing protein [bacterium]